MKLSLTVTVALSFLAASAQAAPTRKTVTQTTQTKTKTQTVTTTPVSPAASAPIVNVSPTRSVLTTHEDWKGAPDTSQASVGLISGLGVVDSSGGFALLGTASTKIVKDGWIDDINESVSVEGVAGVIFTSGTSVFDYGLHLRWDFKKDETWTFYALGGLGGNIQGDKLGNHFELYPRFGIGTLISTGLPFLIRGELSHELITVGMNFPI